MMKKGDFGATPKGKKRSNASKHGDGLYQLSPKWSFVKCDMQHERWGISQNAEHLANMLARFKEWERVTWGDILTTTAGRKSNTQSHSMAVGILDKDAIKRLSVLKLDEYDMLYSLTITGRQRVWGIMIEETGTFQLLWYDPNHEIYSVER
ncbi:hypothetical protein AALD01_14395 [Oscillospiraceae bacterium 21-37]